MPASVRFPKGPRCGILRCVGPGRASSALCGAEIYRLTFAVQGAKRFVLAILGGLTLMVSVWVATLLGTSVFAVANESRTLFVAILGVFVAIIALSFSVAWWVLSGYPRALVVRERGLVLEHGSRTRVLGFDEVRGIEQRERHGMPTYVVLVADGSEIPFGTGERARQAATALVEQAELEWSEKPLRAIRPSEVVPVSEPPARG